MTTATKWSLSGTYFESCNSEVARACIFLRPPNSDDGSCNVLIVWNRETGTFGDIDLSGFNVAKAAHAPGLMVIGKSLCTSAQMPARHSRMLWDKCSAGKLVEFLRFLTGS